MRFYICDLQGMEATMYALIMSVNNLGGVVGSQFGAAITVSHRMLGPPHACLLLHML
jgi:hypothetical protein